MSPALYAVVSDASQSCSAPVVEVTTALVCDAAAIDARSLKLLACCNGDVPDLVGCSRTPSPISAREVAVHGESVVHLLAARALVAHAACLSHVDGCCSGKEG
jgi:hypothetical protein